MELKKRFIIWVLIELRNFRIRKKNHSIQKLIRQHLANENLTTSILQEKIAKHGIDLDLNTILESSYEISDKQLYDLSKFLNESYLMMPEYSVEESVVITSAIQKTVIITLTIKKYYKIHTLARRKMPNTKSFNIEVLCNTHDEKYL